ncbi:MAG TPA: discoidin domain-containing protein [Polyangiaceae bacterium]|nr:discoidin domain-containing protein [Polyangiaceae bacterium]
MIRSARLILPMLAAAVIAGACGGPAFSSAGSSANSGGSGTSMSASSGGSNNPNNPNNPNSPSTGGTGQGGSGAGFAGALNLGGRSGVLDCTVMGDCDDSNPCTLDVCTSDNACLHVPADGTCDSDNDDCTSDVCGGGLCTHPANGTCNCRANGDCNDSNPCTDDSCGNGHCQYQNNTAPCADDGNPCSDDQCSAGACMHSNNTATCADDNDTCTDDVCGGGLCTHPSNGQCGCTSAQDCDDSNPCTDDSCDNQGACQYANNNNPCGDDGNACTTDACHQGNCAHMLAGAPIPEKIAWTALTSDLPSLAIPGCPGDPDEPPEQAIDGMPATRWTTGSAQSGDEWFEVDFGAEATLNHVNLDAVGIGGDTCGSSPNDFPRHYQISLSDTSGDYQAPVLAEGDGVPGNNLILLPQPATGRYLRIWQTGSTVADVNANWWSIHEISVSCQ